MKILHISTANDWRGGEAQVYYLARGLRQKGHEVQVVAPPQSPLLQKCIAEGCEVFPLAIRSDTDIRAFWKLDRLLQQTAPTLIHAHDAHAHTASVFGRLLGVPSKLVVNRRVSYAPRSNWINHLKYGQLVNCFIAVSRTIAQQLFSLGIESRRVVTVRSGIEVDRFRQRVDTSAFKRDFRLPEDKRLLGVVSPLSPQKEQEVFLRAACRLVKTRNDVHFVLVGEGETRPSLERLAERLGIQHAVTFTGFIEDVVPAYQSFHVAILPSSSGEGSPAVIKEAMASGVPVIAIDESNIREIVDHGVNGILVPPQNDEAMAKMITLLIEDRELYAKLLHNAELAVDDFDIQKTITSTEEVYLRLLGARIEKEP